MATLKMTGCMKLVSKMSDGDQTALLDRLDQYQADGVAPERAQLMAAQDMLAEIQGERESLYGLLKEQHPDLFTVTDAPAAQMSRSRADLRAAADAIAAMDEDVRDNTEIGDVPGGPDGYNLYEARKLAKKPSDKLKRVTDSNSFSLWQNYDYIANVDGELFGVTKQEDPDDTDDETKFVFDYQRLDNPDVAGKSMSDQVDELFAAMRKGGAQLSRARSPLGLYSALADGLDGIKTNAAPVQGWKDAIKGLVNKGQVKTDEVEWSGVNDWLDLQQGKVNKQQVAEYLKQGGVQVAETVLGERSASTHREFGNILDAQDFIAEFHDQTRAEMIEDYGFANPRDYIDAANQMFNDQFPDSRDNVAKYGQYTLPGGTNYREVLLTLPIAKRNAAGMAEADRLDEQANTLDRQGLAAWTERGDMGAFNQMNEQARELRRLARAAEKKGGTESYKYQSKHWDQPNVVAHIRLNDRTDADGKRVLFVEELQSDWGQEGKKRGFKKEVDRAAIEARMQEITARLRQIAKTVAPEDVPELAAEWNRLSDEKSELTDSLVKAGNGIPAAPFVTKTEGWLNLALKRVMVMAAEGGYDKVAFVNGEQSAERYDLSKQIEMVTAYKETGGGFRISATDVNGNTLPAQKAKDEAELEGIVGKELATKIAAQKSVVEQYSGLDLKVGGEGMKTFYDAIVPSALKKLLPKVGGEQVAVIEVKRPAAPKVPGKVSSPRYWEQPGFDVTPAMLEKVAGGLPLFSPRRNMFGQQAPAATWLVPDDTYFDRNVIFQLQDKQVDLKRVIAAVKTATGGLADKWDAYLQEELYHGRAAKATKDFASKELKPLLEDMQSRGVSMADFEEFLHNRHAEERNNQIATINAAMPDGGSGIDTADARAYLAGLTPAKRRAFDALAARTDAITAGTRQLLVASGLETQDTIDKWESAYGSYVPLMREDLDYGLPAGSGTGQGFSVRGSSSRRATGSSRPVVDIMANLAMQRERVITRAEKTRVGTALYGLAVQNPNTDFWLAVDPASVKDPAKTIQDLVNLGINPLDAKNIIEEPKQTYLDPKTGLVTQRVNPSMRSADNVLAVRINGEDRFVFFNNNDERAKRMSAALKNLDGQQLNMVLGASAVVSRYFASINTQYNPVFGAVNVMRDIQGALFNLSTTAIADKKAEVLGGVPGAAKGIYQAVRADRKGRAYPPGSWAQLWDEFQAEGGQTGFRDLFKDSSDRAKGLESELNKISEGTLKQAGRAVFDWLSDYNETLENAVRLSAYKAAKGKGLSNEQAASIAKNLTVNFNRKGNVTTQAGALYAFFNASVQGTARLAETLKGPAGKKILYGGLLLGSAQAMLLAAADFDDDEPPDFIKERSLVIPTGDGKYLSVPMPLGLNVIPNTGRILTEWALSGGKDSGKRIAQITGAMLDMFNPIGNAGWSLQTLAPTAIDPLAALAENKDWSGRPIAKKDMSGTDPSPGFTRAKDTASWISKQLSYVLNLASGGTDYKPGGFSPTPDQIDYLLGQGTGGVGREILKVSQAVESSVTGEELPTYKVPLVGRFYGDTKEQSAVSGRYYANITELNAHERELKGRRENRGNVAEYIRENPDARLVAFANNVERDVSKLRKRKREMLEQDRPAESIKMIEMQISRRMKQLNDRVEQAQETQ